MHVSLPARSGPGSSSSRDDACARSSDDSHGMSDLVEYPQGGEFPGVIGRTVQESSPAWPAPPRAKDGAPNVLFCRARRRRLRAARAASAAWSRRRTSTASRRPACATRTCTRPRCARRRARRILTGRNHHSSGVACIMELATGYPGYDGRMPFENGMLPEMLVPEGYNTFCLGKWHLSPSEENTPAGPFHRWPLGRGFERFYGFLGGETNQWYPDLTLDNSADAPAEGPRGRLPPQRGPRRPGDQDGARRARQRAREAVLHVLRARRRARAAPRRQGVGRPLQGQVRRRLGRLPRDRVREPEARSGCWPPTPQLSPRDPDVPEWSTLSADERRLYARMMEVFAGFVSHADHHFGRDPRHARADRRARQHADHGHLRQRRLGRGRRHRLVQRDALLQPGAGELRGQPRAHRRPRRAVVLQPLRVGLGVGRRHAVPALEARDLPRRLDRPVRPRLAGRDGGARRDPHAVRARDRHGADRARRARHRAAGGDPRRAADAAGGRQLRAHVRRRRTPPSKHVTQYFEMFGHRAIYHDGWRAVCPWPAPNFTEAAQARAQARRADHARDPGRARPQRLGALPHGRRPDASRPNVAAEHPEVAARPDRALVGGGREVQGPPARRLDAGAARDRAPADLQAADPLRLLPGRLGRAGVRGAAGLQPRRTRSRPTSRSRPAAPRACCSPRAATPAATPSTSRTAGSASSTTTSASTASRCWPTTAVSPEGRHALRYEFEPTGAPDIANGKGVPGRGQLYIDGKLVGATRVPAHDAAVLRARRAELRLRLRRPGGRGTRRRSRSPARSARSPSTSPAS